MTQTAIEWLHSRLQTEPFLTVEDFNKAKEMEKEQMINFHIEVMKVGLINEGETKWNDGYLPLIRKTAEKYFKTK